MNIFKRAFASITRRTTKTIILFLIFTMLFTILGAGLAIGESVKSVDRTMKEIMGARVSMKIEQQYDDTTLSGISYDTIKSYAENKNVKYFDYNIISQASAQLEDQSLNTTLYGYSYQPMIDVITQKIKIVDGELLTQEQLTSGDNAILISSELADVYGLKVGDQLNVTTSFSYSKQMATIIDEIHNYFRASGHFSYQIEVSTGNDAVDDFVNNYYSKYYEEFVRIETVPFVVQGIFELRQGATTVDKDEDGYYSTRIYVANQYLETSYSNVLAEAMSNHEEVFEVIPTLNERIKNVANVTLSKTLEYEPTYILNSIDAVKQFIIDTRVTLPGNVSFVEANDGIYAVNKQMSSVSTIASTITFVSLFATIVIVPLCLLLFLRERRKEFGIYASIGLRKRKTVAQVLIETMTVAGLALVISFFSGTMIARNLSDQMINLQFSVASVDESGAEMVSFLTNDEIKENYRVKITADYVLTMTGLGLGTVLIASVVPVIYVLRLKPRKILL